MGTVEQVESRSVLLRHSDGQAIWWAMAALIMHTPAPGTAIRCRRNGREDAADTGGATTGGRAVDQQGPPLWCGATGGLVVVVAAGGMFALVDMPHPVGCMREHP